MGNAALNPLDSRRPDDLGDAADAAALPPFGLSPVARSQRYRAAAAIAGVCLDLLERQHERNIEILTNSTRDSGSANNRPETDHGN